MMRVYVASSWRNSYQPDVVRLLRACGHDVYDFRNPSGGTGFAWSQIDPNWQEWTTEQYAEALQHDVAVGAAGGSAADVRAVLGALAASRRRELTYWDVIFWRAL